MNLYVITSWASSRNKKVRNRMSGSYDRESCSGSLCEDGPDGLHVAAFNKLFAMICQILGIKHSVGGADYGSVRVGAFMGRKIIQSVATDWRGADDAEDYGKYVDHGDPITVIDKKHEYELRATARHPESRLQQAFKALLTVNFRAINSQLWRTDASCHYSYSACGPWIRWDE
ncbi:hypothetical protein Leryth_013254 [Lithospermum erythrorhizon]|nr:hypothetical protein Leryth_013254 [Lithospermum erythrorhizon]